jgi:hypothetical protein
MRQATAKLVVEPLPGKWRFHYPLDGLFDRLYETPADFRISAAVVTSGSFIFF